MCNGPDHNFHLFYWLVSFFLRVCVCARACTSAHVYVRACVCTCECFIVLVCPEAPLQRPCSMTAETFHTISFCTLQTPHMALDTQQTINTLVWHEHSLFLEPHFPDLSNRNDGHQEQSPSPTPSQHRATLQKYGQLGGGNRRNQSKGTKLCFCKVSKS